MTNPNEGWGASAELNKMRKNPLFNQLRAQSTIDTGRYGNLQQDVINYDKMSRGREQLNKFSNSQKELYLPNDNIGPSVNRRNPNMKTGAAMGTNSEWAMPKLHDPFEWFRERCLVRGQKILLRDSIKSVEDVVVGDYALTHLGNYRRVAKVGSDNYQGYKYTLKSASRDPIIVTEGHRIWARKRYHRTPICGCGFYAETERARKKHSDYYYSKGLALQHQFPLEIDTPDWVYVEALEPGDKIFIPINFTEVDRETISIWDNLDQSEWRIEDGVINGHHRSQFYKVRTLKHQLETEFKINDELLWLMGFWAAEGSGNKNGLRWSNTNTKYTDRVAQAIRDNFGLEPLTYTFPNNHNITEVVMNCKPLATWFINMFGSGAATKHIPEWIRQLPVDKYKHFLRGYFDGDGSYGDECKAYSLSDLLINQLDQLLLKAKIIGSVHKDRTKHHNYRGSQLNISGANVDIFYELIDIKQEYGRKYSSRHKTPVEWTNTGVWIDVESVIESEHNDLIYNISVEEDHSYCVSGIAVRNTWFFNMEDPDEQTRKIRDWARLIYTTHYLVPSMIDIYSRFPLLGMEFAHPDKRVNEFFSELFWDGLQYQDFLYSLSREHWLIGDVFALGSWNDGIGAWEADELINPNDVVVAKNRALRTYQYHIKVPEEVKKLVETRQPEKEYAMLMAMYPDVVEYARKDVEIPVSDVIMKGIPYRTNPWAEHGTPILMRAFRQLMMEESLQASMEAISDRLYSPLILATLGLPDADGDGPWIPDAEELGQLRDDLAMAINADFRLICQPPGTIVTKVVNGRGNNGRGGCQEPVYEYVPIETLEKGDRVLSYDIGSKRLVKFGNPIMEIGSRDFDGELVCVDSDGSKSRYTPDHICLVKLGETFYNKHSVYVMQKGNQFRVGTNGPNPGRKNGPPGEYSDPRNRFKNEHSAEAMWIIDTFDTAQEARMVENLVSCKYGLPQVRFSYNGQQRSSTEIIPEKFWEFYGDNYESGINVLEAYGRDINLPLLTKIPGQNAIGEGRLNYSEILRVRAVNLLHGMEVLKTDGVSWSPIKISHEYYQGPVWSMDVEKHHTYVGDGIVTHNCYHHGLEIQNAFGRESMPRLDQDFYRIQGNYMMVFGIGSELLQGGKSGATYASGALNRELITQMLTTHQHQIKHFIQGRMRAVAERQGFYEYRNVGGHPVPIMETVLVVDEETGAQFVEERPKLAIPDIIFQSMNLQDENIEHQFLGQLVGLGLPVSYQTFTRNVGIDFEDEIETVKKEKVDLVIAEQQVKKDIFDRCFQLQLPIPMEYQAEYEAYLMQLQDPQLAEQLRPGAIQDLSSPTPTPNIGGQAVHTDINGIPNMYPSIANQETLDQRQHPPESHEQKKTQPKRSKTGKPNGPQKKTASVEDGEMLVASKKTGENIIIEEGNIVSNVGQEGGEWGKYRKSNPKKASVTEEFQGNKDISYGDRMKFSVPWESQYRTQMKLANGQKIVVDDNYEKYDEMYMKDHIAKILESNVQNAEDDDFNDKLNEQIIPTNMDFDHHKSDMMGFDAPAITGVNPEDMGPKVTFGSQEFPNRKNDKKDKNT